MTDEEAADLRAECELLHDELVATRQAVARQGNDIADLRKTMSLLLSGSRTQSETIDTILKVLERLIRRAEKGGSAS